MKKLFVLLLSLFVFMLSSYSQEESEDVDVFEILNNKTFVFEANHLSAQNGSSKSLTSEYYLTVEGDSAQAHLPYIGEAYVASFNSEGGINFDNIMENYSSELKEKKKEKNNCINISFEVRGEGDVYRCFLSAGKSGFASLSINCNSRQSISYSGNIVPIKK